MIKISIKELEVWYDDKHIMQAVESDGYALQYVPEGKMTEAVALKAVERNGYALKYVMKELWHLFEHMITE